MRDNAAALKEARAANARTYFTGRPCSHGHIAERLTANRTCVECARSTTRKCNKSETRKLKVEAWRAANSDRLKDSLVTYRKENLGRRRLWNAKWATANPEKARALRKQWREANKHVVNALHATRKASKARAVCLWADMAEIKRIYAEARGASLASGEKMAVDHIVPIQSPFVCGLHNEFNLQVLTREENSRKSNKWWPGMEGWRNG